MPMSFDLPRNARELRFTGEAKVVGADDTPKGALGKPRVRKPSTPPARVPVGGSSRTSGTNVTAQSPQPTARRGAVPATRPSAEPVRIITPLPSYGQIRAPRVGPRDIDSDENPTVAMDRDGADVLPGGRLRNGPPSSEAPNRPPSPVTARPIPHFRSQPLPTPSAFPVQSPGEATSPLRASAPYAVWVLASILMGILSFHLAPEILARLDAPKPSATATP